MAQSNNQSNNQGNNQSSSQNNQAIDLKTNSVVFVPTNEWQKYFKNQYLNSTNSFQQEVPGYQTSTADGSVQFVSDRAILNAQLKTTMIENLNNKNMHLQLALVSSSVVVNHVNIQANIQKDLGFGSATLKLNVICEQIKVDLSNQNTIDVNLQTQQGVTSVSALKWNLGQSALSTQLIGCTEVAGFDSALKLQIQQLIEQKYVLDILQNYVNTKIHQTILDSLNLQITNYTVSLGLTNNKQIIFDENNNLWIYLIQDATKIFSETDIQKLALSTSVSMLISKSSVEDLIKNNVNQILDKNIISSKNNSAMNKLTCSRLIQTFIWPSLKSLNKCFEMKIQSKVLSVKITDVQNLKLNLQFGSWALSDLASDQFKSLAYFQTNIETNIKSKQANIASFGGQADKGFISWSGKSKRISISTIQGPLQTLLNQVVVNIGSNEYLKLFLQNANVQQVSSDGLIFKLNH